MSKLQIVIACAAMLLASLGVSAALFPFAAMSEADLQRSQTPQPMEDFADVDLGPDFGTLPVAELIGYYIENPPAPQVPGAAPGPVRLHFGGC